MSAQSNKTKNKKQSHTFLCIKRLHAAGVKNKNKKMASCIQLR